MTQTLPLFFHSERADCNTVITGDELDERFKSIENFSNP